MPVLGRARSLCPICLRVIDAHYVADALGSVFLEKNCPEHGPCSTPVWAAKPGAPAFADWKSPTRPGHVAVPGTERRQ